MSFPRNHFFPLNSSSSANASVSSIKPSAGSLSNGNDILVSHRRPVPATASSIQHNTPPATPLFDRLGRYPSTATSLRYNGGPLSSNPVTPISTTADDDDDDMIAIDQNTPATSPSGTASMSSKHQVSNSASDSTGKTSVLPTTGIAVKPYHDTPVTALPQRPLYYSQCSPQSYQASHTHNSLSKGTTGPTDGHQQQQPRHERRPSLARRFLRSISSVHNLSGMFRDADADNDTSSSSNQSSQQHQRSNSTRRVFSTPASSFNGSDDMVNLKTNGRRKRRASKISVGAQEHLNGYDHRNGEGGVDGSTENNEYSSSRPSASFPRMVRKKSMDFLSSAKRRSGLWGGSTRSAAGDQTSSPAGNSYREAALEAERRREALLREEVADMTMIDPPPMLPELGHGLNGGSLGEGDIFAHIGR